MKHLLGQILVSLLIMGAGWVHSDSAQSAETDQTPENINNDAEHKAKLDDIRILLSLLDGDSLRQRVVLQLGQAFKQNMPDAPEALWKDALAKITTSEIAELSVAAYDHHLSHPDVLAAIAFYRSDSGHHFVAATSDIAKESMSALQAWGMEFTQRVNREVRQERVHSAASDRPDEAHPPIVKP